MEHYFVFQHSLSIVVIPIDQKIDQFISSLDFPIVKNASTATTQELTEEEEEDPVIDSLYQLHMNPSLHDLNYVLYLKPSTDSLFYFGKLQEDPDQKFEPMFQVLNLPKAEYIFLSKKINLQNLPSLVKNLSETLKKKELSMTSAPLIVFPENLPISMNQAVIMEIWIATNSDINANERLSDELTEAFPRKRFDFYRW